MPDSYVKARIEASKCVISLCKALDAAGGVIREDILDMTLASFISEIAAQNHIEFRFAGQEE